MKKFYAVFAALIAAALLFSACSMPYIGIGSEGSASESPNSLAPFSPEHKTDSYLDYDSAPPVEAPDKDASGDGQSYTTTTGDARSFADKMIYSAEAQVETTDFDAAVAAVQDLLTNYGAFLESSYVTGQSYSAKWNNYEPMRSARYVIRVPAAGYRSLTQNLSALGNVTSLREYTSNITEQYYDAQARLDTYKLEQERVLSMLEKASTVSEMLELESRLSTIRYNIESITSRLRNWQNEVDYSTVTVNITEVRRLTDTADPNRSYWQQMGDGFMSTLSDIGVFFSEAALWFVSALPVLLIAAVVIAVVILIVRSAVKKRRAKRDRPVVYRQPAGPQEGSGDGIK